MLLKLVMLTSTTVSAGRFGNDVTFMPDGGVALYKSAPCTWNVTLPKNIKTPDAMTRIVKNNKKHL